MEYSDIDFVDLEEMKSHVNTHNSRSGQFFEIDVCMKLEQNLNLKVFGSKTRVKMRESELTFDIDLVVGGKNNTHLVEVKKSVSDSTVAKIYCQYMAWFDELLHNRKSTDWTFTVIYDGTDDKKAKRTLRNLKKLVKLSNFRYVDSSLKSLKTLDWS